MKTELFRTAAALLLAAASLTTWAAPGSPGPYNTGLDAAGTPLASNAVDPHYSIVNSTAFGPAAYAKHDADGPPITAGVWLLDAAGPTSSWLVPATDFYFGDVPGVTDNITYRTTFDLSGYATATGRIKGVWAADDSGLEIRLNGVAVPGVVVAQYDRWTAFDINAGFIAGINTLEFDTLSTQSPTGLRAEFTNIFQPVPEPATWALVMAGLGGVLLVRRRAGGAQ